MGDKCPKCGQAKEELERLRRLIIAVADGAAVICCLCEWIGREEEVLVYNVDDSECPKCHAVDDLIYATLEKAEYARAVAEKEQEDER